ncbi:MAG: hypothetical protein JW982_03990 [Spirochaetes bacterium]|nr:hypothetical protein [Spirochaetota bacterium]
MRKYILNIFTVVVFALLISCSTAFEKKSTIKIDVQNEIIYFKKDTKSERKEGSLIINNYKLPDIFLYVEADSKGFIFIENGSPFGKSGYFLAEEQKIIPDSKTVFQKVHFDKGFYESNERFTNTPNSYIYVEWKKGSAFIDAEKLSEIMEIKPFSEIESMTYNIYEKK